MNGIILGMKAEAVKKVLSGKKSAELIKKRPSLLELPIKVLFTSRRVNSRSDRISLTPPIVTKDAAWWWENAFAVEFRQLTFL